MKGEGNMLGVISVGISVLNLKVLLSENCLDCIKPAKFLPLFPYFLPSLFFSSFNKYCVEVLHLK
jgi:hypothetical protein